MNNKKVLICVAVLMFIIGVSCIFASVMLTAPQGGDISSTAPSGDIVADNSIEVSNASADSSLEDVSLDISVDYSEDEPIPQIILPPGTVVNSQIAVVYDVSLGEVIYAQNENAVTAPASLTKLLTALVALDHLAPGKTITVGEEINLIGENSSVAFLAVGQKYTVKSLIDALLIPSGNDAAYVLAVNTARVAANDNNLSIEKAVSDFVRLMNDKARKLGCVSSYFCTPDGYDAEGQQTTALDVVKISIEARKNATIRESVQKEKSGGWVNSNALVCKSSSYYNECVTGLKTGSTGSAGYCVSVSAEIDTTPYIMVFLNSPTRDGRFRDANTFIELIKNNREDNSGDVSAAA